MCRSLNHGALLSLIVVGLMASPVMGQVVINEYVAAGLEGFHDEYGEFSDWIELFNSGAEPVDLTDWTLGDDAADPDRWTFPSRIIAPAEHLLVCASGYPRTLFAEHFETVIDWGDTWRYFVAAPPTNWMTSDFDDDTWASGPSGFGFGDDDDATDTFPARTFYLRHQFTIGDLPDIRFLVLHIDFDDAFVAYLNGVEIARSNIGVSGTPPLHDTLAYDQTEAIFSGEIPPYRWIIDTEQLRQGTNTLAISVHNADDSDDQADMTCIPILTLGRRTPGDAGPSPHMAAYLPNLHCDFQLDADGEVIILCDALGEVRDMVVTRRLWMDVSSSRCPDGGPDWLYFDTPTPGAPCGLDGYALHCPAPILSPQGGHHAGPVAVELTSPVPGLAIHYTLDGSEPDDTSPLYSEPIAISATGVIRARCLQPGQGASRIATCTYLIGENSTLPIVSLSLNPDDLWSADTGIYVLGNGDYTPEPPNWGANFWSDWEKSAHCEFYEPDGTLGFSQDLGVKIHGGATRCFPQKSLRLMARGGYGADRINYPVFPDKEITSFSRLLLRNGGNDWLDTQFRDGMIQNLTSGFDLDRQAFRPAVLFLNGEYWGLHNIREQIGSDYLFNNHGCDPETVDLLAPLDEVIEGAPDAYSELLAYIADHDLALPEHFAVVDSLMDTTNYANYFIFQVFCNNVDWPGNNIKFWRAHESGSRWRWILYDTEFGLGYYMDQQFDMLAFATDPDGCCWSNPAWATFLIRNLLTNDDFRRDFINRYCELLGGVFLPGELAAALDDHTAVIADEIPRHFTRWAADPADWSASVAVVRSFIAERPTYAREHLRNLFGLGDTLRLTFAADPPASGVLRLLTRDVTTPWSADFHADHDILLRAVPHAGYAFDGWSDPTLPATATITVTPTEATTYTARFRLEDSYVMINEINYNSAVDFDPGDWVEIFNAGSEAVDLSGWGFRDGNDTHRFTFPEGTGLRGNRYLVLCRDPDAFALRFPSTAALPLDFGFDNDGERLQLLDPFDAVLDEVTYGDADPWPTGPDGGGFTLELINPTLDNALSTNWGQSRTESHHGTPGYLNSIDCGCIDDNGEPVQAVILSTPWPNPFNGECHFDFSMPNTAQGDLSIFNVAGRHVATIENGIIAKGWKRYSWDGGGCGSGVYFVRLQVGDTVRTAKIMLLK
ncbi:MAG: T9SS type A sorting domain-containing protein [bacterium]|nr:T9SS type A sorting domain-containing protein [bacterium]